VYIFPLMATTNEQYKYTSYAFCINHVYAGTITMSKKVRKRTSRLYVET
jgi:hypothetical protein